MWRKEGVLFCMGRVFSLMGCCICVVCVFSSSAHPYNLFRRITSGRRLWSFSSHHKRSAVVVVTVVQATA